MKGRKLPLGGSSRSRRSASEDQTNSTPASDTPTGRTRLRSPSLPAGSSVEQTSQGSAAESAPRIKTPKPKSDAPGSTRSKSRRNLGAEGSPKPVDPVANNEKSPINTGEASIKRLKSPKGRGDEASRRVPQKRRNVNGDVNGSGSENKSEDTPQDSPNNARKRPFAPGDMPSLIAVEVGRKNKTTVKLSLNGTIYVPVSPSHDSSNNSSSARHLGHDGNQYYCQVCHEFGNVVCCDGCPRVYHQDCIPAENPARKSLENDEDPWFCPKCIKKKKSSPSSKPSRSSTRSSQRSDKADRRSTSQNRCVDCGRDIAGLAIEPCSGCGNYVHSPSCIEDDSERPGRASQVLCSTCRAVEELTKEEDDIHEVTERSIDDLGKRGRSSRAAKERGESSRRNENDLDDERDEDDVDSEYAGPRRKKKRTNSLPDKEKKKKKKKKRKKIKGTQSPTAEGADTDGEDAEDEYLAQAGSSENIRATPAFYFYLGENRWKIERVLARKHRYFNRLPKGRDRNELVAREAALWWVKLRPTDHRRYMTMSIRDLESRIIHWKEEKNLREMLTGETGKEAETVPLSQTTQRTSQEDDERALERHEKRFRGTSVGSKPFKPEPDHSYNRVLLDLLHDMRFHPCPMVSVNRSDSSAEVDDHASRATIPYFDVHGPISTSIGDECMGCSRGWRHFCSVLKRAVPAVEHRAKLQPPMSSLMATRIGLGLRPRLESVEEADNSRDVNSRAGGHIPLYSWAQTEEPAAISQLPVVPSSSLQDVPDRFDDIVLVIEETTAMRVKEPPPPEASEQEQSAKSSAARSLPTQRSKGQNVSTSQNAWHKCGRCRTVSESDMGCIQCRRAQLVINMTKKQPHASDSSKHQGKALKVQTVMLGRVHMKEGSGETQSEGDQAVCNAMLKQRWTPMAVLRSEKQHAPSPSSGSVVEEVEEEEAETEAEEKIDPVEDLEEEPSAMELDETVVETTKEESPLSAANRQSNERPRARNRPTRLLVSSASTKDYNGTDRRKETERNEKVEALNAQCVTIACYGIFLAVLRRDPLKLFAAPATDDDYMDTVEKPIDLGAIREKVLGNAYTTVEGALADLRLLCENSLSFYPAHSAHWKTAKDISDQIGGLETKANEWIKTLNQAYDSYLLRQDQLDDTAGTNNSTGEDPFSEIRQECPEAVEMLEKGENLRSQIKADIVRTRENETAYYGTLAIRRAALAAANSLAPYTDGDGPYSLVVRRDTDNDEALRELIDSEVASHTEPVELGQVSSWREESVVRLLRKVQSRRMERRSATESGSSRCIAYDANADPTVDDEMFHSEKRRKRNDDASRKVDQSRLFLTTGLGSAKVCQGIVKREEGGTEGAYETVKDCRVSVRASRIHGMGLFADQPFKKGDVVTEYVGEYIDDEVADAREKKYRKERRQDFIFRIHEKLAIDATMKGGPARFMNHNCEPNCYSNIIPGPKGKEHLQRVILMAQQDIEINEEITFDYRIPLELDLNARIPCNCQSDACRGFMNWDLPETGSNNRALLVHKRGANMRDRIRRLRRPLKRDES